MPDATPALSAPGLAAGEARRRLARDGPNEFRPRTTRTPWAGLGRRLRDPLIVVLLGASLLAAVTGEAASFAMIATMIVLSVAIDVAQEHRASRAAETLIRRVQLHARVLRDGAEVAMPASHIVRGDAVVLSAGAVVPADGVLAEANGVHVDEALLTGEPFPVARGAGAGLRAGTSVVSGAGLLVVTRTGARTEIARLAARLDADPPPTSFERGTRRFGLLVMRMTALLVLLALLASVAVGRPLPEAFIFALALAVGLTPELLPMIVTVTLSSGAMRLARDHVIVRRLAAVEGLGAMDVLCTDKTGTLTAARIRLECAVDARGAPCARVRDLAVLNSAFQRGIHNPLDDAILASTTPEPGWHAVAEAPFDFERRRVGMLVARAEERLLVVKGAPAPVMGLCGDPGPDARATLARLESAGHRVLAVASRRDARLADARDERGLALEGFLAFADPPKAGAAEALRALRDDGVAVKVLTGDGEAVTRHVCAQVGLPVRGVLLGEQVDRLDGPALAAWVESVTLFCRVTPAQKERVVRALAARGHGVGYIGDGVNDAPALHSADVGISVDNAVDVAREAADIILLRRDLGVLHRGVIEGRRTLVNIRKYLLMATSSNFGNMATMAAAAAFLPFLPLLPAQVLLNNLLYDVSEVALPLDSAERSETAVPQRWDIDLVRDFMWVMGPVSSLFDVLTFAVLLGWLGAGEALFRSGWFVESLATQVLVVFVIRTRGSALASRPSMVLVATALAVVALAVALPYTPLAPALGLVPLPAEFLAVLAVLVAAYLALAEVVKRRFFARRARLAVRQAAAASPA